MRTLPLLLLLALALPAAGAPEDALRPTTRRVYEAGRDLERDDDLAGAARQYRTVLELEPHWLQAVVDLGRVLEALELPAEAEAAYRRAPFDPDAVEALGRLLLGQDRPDEALVQFRVLRDLRTDTPEFLLLEADAAARQDPAEGRRVLLEYLERPAARLASSEGVAVSARVCRALWDAERSGRALAAGLSAMELVETVRARLELEGLAADSPDWVALAGLVDRLEVEDEARRLSVAADRPLTPEQRERLDAALARLRAGHPGDAQAALEALAREAPASALVRGALADTHLARGAIEAALRQAQQAEQLDPLDPVHSARVGDLLYEHFGGRMDGEAADAWDRAVSRPNASPELWFRKAEAERAAGLHGRSVASHRAYVERVPDGARAEASRRFVAGSERTAPEPPDAPALPALPEGVRAEHWQRYWIAVVLAQPPRGSDDDLSQALDELEPVLAAAPDWTEARNLRAAIALRQGEPELARSLYARSLEQDPSQGDVMLVLADLERAKGNEEQASALEQQAATVGEPRAHLRLGLRDEAAWRYLSAREHLRAYLSWSRRDREEARDQAAVAAAARIERRLRGVALVGVVGLGLGLALPVQVRRRSRSGAALEQLISAAPVVWPDVARILSAIRHEVLKHHTTVLDSVARELEVGDPALGAWAADRLAGPRGAVASFGRYVAELEQLGRAHGVRLNLRHRDPDFGPLIAAMDELERLLPELRAGRAAAATELRRVSGVLNGAGYRAMGGLLRRLCLLPLEAELIRDSWKGVQSELRSEVQLELDLPGDGILLRIFRRELDDILANVLRNALEAASDGPNPRVGVRVAADADWITGLERVEIRVMDTAARKISTAMIRGRYIGRGLGLAVDLISRNGGSIHVEDEPGWSKAVVIRLPRAEAPDLEDR